VTMRSRDRRSVRWVQVERDVAVRADFTVGR
jgi:hypothetical protein